MSDEGMRQRLLAVITEVTGRPCDGLQPDEDLIAGLGLDSLTGLRVLARVEQRFSVRFPDRQLADLRTLRALEAAIAPATGVQQEQGGAS